MWMTSMLYPIMSYCFPLGVCVMLDKLYVNERGRQITLEELSLLFL